MPCSSPAKGSLSLSVHISWLTWDTGQCRASPLLSPCPGDATVSLGLTSEGGRSRGSGKRWDHCPKLPKDHLNLTREQNCVKRPSGDCQQLPQLPHHPEQAERPPGGANFCPLTAKSRSSIMRCTALAQIAHPMSPGAEAGVNPDLCEQGHLPFHPLPTQLLHILLGRTRPSPLDVSQHSSADPGGTLPAQPG